MLKFATLAFVEIILKQRSLASKRALHSAKKVHISERPGYSPPIVDFELDDGTTSSIVVSDADMPALCFDDIVQVRGHLSLILNARRGDPEALEGS